MKIGGSHYGNVLVGNRPVCDKNWDTVDAQVVCRDLGHSDATKAIPMTNSAFGGVNENFLIDDVQCTGSEYKLRQCAYKTRPDCRGADAAGVVCIDHSKLRLVGGGLREGNVFIGDQPVCHDLWDISDGQVVCGRGAAFNSTCCFLRRGSPLQELSSVSRARLSSTPLLYLLGRVLFWGQFTLLRRRSPSGPPFFAMCAPASP